MLVLPIVLHRFPDEEITLWQVLVTIMGFQFLADIGFGSTGARVVAYAHAGAPEIDQPVDLSNPASHTPNWELLARIAGTLRTIYARLGWVFGFLLLVFGSWAVRKPIGLLSHEATTSPAQAWIAWGIVAVTTVVAFRGNYYSAMLQGVNEIATLRRWEALFACGSIFSAFAVLLAQGNLLALIASNQVWTLASTLRNRWLYQKSFHHRFDVGRSRIFDRRVLEYLWPTAWRTAVGVFMSQGITQLSSLVYAQSPDSRSVASYLVGMRLMQVLNQFSQAPFSSKLPVLARYWAQRRVVDLVEFARRGMALTYWTFIGGFVVIGLAGPVALELIGSKTPFPSQSVWVALGVAILLERYGGMHLQLYTTANTIIWHIVNGVSGAIFAVSAWLLFDWFGVLAMPLGMIAGYALFYCWFSALHSYRQFQLRFFDFDVKTAGLPVAVLVVFALFMLR